MTRLFVGAGRAAGVRPGDLVGAITNEAGLRGGDIGAIQIADGFSLVEVPEASGRARDPASLRGADDPRPEGHRPPRALLSVRDAGGSVRTLGAGQAVLAASRRAGSARSR